MIAVLVHAWVGSSVRLDQQQRGPTGGCRCRLRLVPDDTAGRVLSCADRPVSPPGAWAGRGIDARCRGFRSAARGTKSRTPNASWHSGSAIGFCVGFLGVARHPAHRWYTWWPKGGEAEEFQSPSVGLLAASGLVGHSVMDGFAIGAAFQAGTHVGAVVAVAVIGHDFADGFNTYTVTSLYGNDRRRAITLLAADAVAPVAGAALTLAITILTTDSVCTWDFSPAF